MLAAGYDAAGQRTSLTYPGGLQVSFSYDQNGRLTGLRDSRAGDAVYALDPDGRLLTEQLPGRLARRYHYQAGLLRRFLVIQDGRPVARASFRHDPDDRIASQYGPEQDIDFRYDPAGQLIGVTTRPAGPRPDAVSEPRADAVRELRFGYDAAGNRVRLRHDELETRYRYDAADQLEAAETGDWHAEFGYDTSGRLTEERAGQRRRTIEYDGFGRPVQVTRTGDGREERIKATFNGDGLVPSLTLSTRPEHRDEERSALVRYLWGAGDEVPEILAQRAEPAADDAERDRAGRLTADFAYGYGRTFASWAQGAATFHTDAYGSAIRTEDTEAWVQASSYQVFGAPEPEPGAEHEHADDGREHDGREDNGREDNGREDNGREDNGREDNGREDRELAPPELPRFGYRGELALGPMIDLRARSYDALLGRFTTRDPLTTQPSAGRPTNPYGYADNDPVNNIDPLGTLPFAFSLPGLVTGAAAPSLAAKPAAGTVKSTVTQAMVGPGGNFTSLHNAARDSALAALTAQLATRYGLPAAVAGMRTEFSVPGASKNQTGNPGAIDLLFMHQLVVNAWEVKSAGPGGALAARREAEAAQQVRWYLRFYRSVHPPAIVTPGEPMAAPVGVLGFPTYQVWSPNANTDGAILYQRMTNPPPTPVPYPVLERRAAQQRQAQPHPVRAPAPVPVLPRPRSRCRPG